MNVEFQYPNQQELVTAIRTEFQFLVDDYGFAEVDKRLEPYSNPYSVLYSKDRLEILVEGHSYGSGTAIEFRVKRGWLRRQQDSFDLGWLTEIRRPDLLAPEFPDKRGQLRQLPKLARELKEVASDMLRGDVSVVPQVLAAIAKARIEGDRYEASQNILRAEARSQEAFRLHNYSTVVSLLGPHRHLLNASSLKRLEIAQHRLSGRA